MSTNKMTAEEACRQVLVSIANACDQEALARADGYLFRYVQDETVLRDCGQPAVCRTPPGCARHLEERAREAERRADEYDARLTAVRVALSQAGVPEVEPYPEEGVSDRENALRAGGRVIGAVARIERLAERIESLTEELADTATVARHLRKLFDDAGQGEHNVLALVEHYQRELFAAEARSRAVVALLEAQGCECECGHHPDEHGHDCEICLGCRIGDALLGAASLGAVPDEEAR